MTSQGLSTPISLFAGRSLSTEMEKFRVFMQENPSEGKFMLSEGEKLLGMARNGNYQRFSSSLQSLLLEESTEKNFPFLYFLSKSFELSLYNQHFMISSFLIDNGYPLNDFVPNPLIACMKNRELEDSSCYEVIQFLQLKNFDFDRQVVLVALS